MSTHPSVLMDESFTPEETSAIRFGIESWESESDEQIRFTFISIPHDRLVAIASVRGISDALYEIRESSKDREYCPDGLGFENNVAMTHRERLSGTAVTCYNADLIDTYWMHDYSELQNWAPWSAVAAHEIGHGLKLVEHSHSTEAIMFASVVESHIYMPSCEDIVRLQDIWELNTPKKCQLNVP